MRILSAAAVALAALTAAACSSQAAADTSAAVHAVAPAASPSHAAAPAPTLTPMATASPSAVSGGTVAPVLHLGGSVTFSDLQPAGTTGAVVSEKQTWKLTSVNYISYTQAKEDGTDGDVAAQLHSDELQP